MTQEMDRLREELRTWASRPPHHRATTARTRIAAKIGKQRSNHRYLLATAATGVLALAAILFFVRPGGFSRPGLTISRDPSPTSLIVYELSSGTRVYVSVPRSDTGSAPGDRQPSRGDNG